MTGRRVVIVGDVINDIVAVTREPVRADTDTSAVIRATSGGSAANTAVWAASCGAQVDFVAAVGAHDAAAHIDELTSAGVRPQLQIEPDAATGTIIILAQGEQRAMLTERGANSLLRASSVTDELLAEAGVLHVSGYSILDGFGVSATRELLARASEVGVPVSVNPASVGFISDFGVELFRQAIGGVSILILSSEEARLLTGIDDDIAAAWAIAREVPIVALTRGSAGVQVFVYGTEPVAVPVIPVEVVDPTGAGDAFAAGFLAEWVRSGDAVQAARAGVEVAARAVRVIGGRPVG
ncbi:carbohydrate kinase family protein [Salinibacterium sp. ZJ70]|uniref:carbohydrate kinase family protein n=1 Tax=Salinibacterium sp. ZJ70 TaxID=2708084 RepID=UPI00141F24A2|nr:PfkB family carbohydrate kinase [Salinibacterium sp. ZJ70]